MVPGGRGIGRLDRLDIRLVLVLGLALLPVGLIAVVQTYRIIDLAENQFRAALVGETLSAARSERDILLREIGASRALVPIVENDLDSPDQCSSVLTDLVQRSENIAFAGVIDTDGSVFCGSEGLGASVADSPLFTSYMEDPREQVVFTPRAGVSGTTGLVIRQPLRSEDDSVFGYLALTVPVEAFDLRPPETNVAVAEDILTVNQDGEILTSFAGPDGLEDRLPRDRALPALMGPERLTFETTDQIGRERVYTVVPLLDGVAYVMGIWQPQSVWPIAATAASATIFPLLMWLASLAVAYFAVHRLVVRHIRALRRRIRAFTMTRKLIPDADDSSMPAELREVNAAFQSMTERIVRDEADQENSIHEKDVLLKEVHHRVKNNLQLIASITNMQIRKSPNVETRFILKRLQDRVMGLATIHRNLYATGALSEIGVDSLLLDLTQQLTAASHLGEDQVAVTTDIRPLTLYPDQAVPLALLLTEALTNAVKYLGRPQDGSTPWISIHLITHDDGEIELCVANSTGDPVSDSDPVAVSGLGSQLIAAFTLQLGGNDISHDAPDRHEIRITFRPSDFSAEIA
ncbi:sensor histidine kinase [Tranquillimonas rosea]|uniref:sensor histidine kinase n=1 Tax=Tranquillimonas rosea TaxID=641238 RepID=UPI003BADA27F